MVRSVPLQPGRSPSGSSPQFRRPGCRTPGRAAPEANSVKAAGRQSRSPSVVSDAELRAETSSYKGMMHAFHAECGDGQGRCRQRRAEQVHTFDVGQARLGHANVILTRGMDA